MVNALHKRYPLFYIVSATSAKTETSACWNRKMTDNRIVVAVELSNRDYRSDPVLEIFKKDPNISFYSDGHHEWWYITLAEKTFKEWVEKDLGGENTPINTTTADMVLGNRIFLAGSFHYAHTTNEETPAVCFHIYMAHTPAVLSEKEAKQKGIWYDVLESMGMYAEV
jgi:hypothetical protein